jgi:hypothetical protein
LTRNGDNEPIGGQWDYTDPTAAGRVVDLFAVKAGNQFALYEYTDANTDNMRNIGIWDTGDVDSKGMSHVTGYRLVGAVPEPGSLFVWLVLGVAGVVCGLRRRNR